MRQIPFDLALPPRFGADDFLVAPSNQAAFAAVERWPDWPDKVMILVGPAGAGKTHLASMWAERAGGLPLFGNDLVRIAPGLLAETHGMIDDADQVGAREAALFHLLNLWREQGRYALLTARSAPDNWGLRTPDLLSRLRLAPMLRLAPPDDALVRAVLIKLFADRQVTVEASVVDYLSRRMERSIAGARRLVETLDQASLAAGRPITRAIAADALASLEAADASRHGDVTGVAQNPPCP